MHTTCGIKLATQVPYKMQSTWFDSENNSRYAMQKKQCIWLKVAGKSTFCSWVYAIQSSNQHSFQKTICNRHWLNLIGSSVDPMQLLDTVLYWQWVKHNYRLRTGSVFNCCAYYVAARWRMWIFDPLQTTMTICFGEVWSHKMQITLHFTDVSTSSTFE